MGLPAIDRTAALVIPSVTPPMPRCGTIAAAAGAGSARSTTATASRVDKNGRPAVRSHTRRAPANARSSLAVEVNRELQIRRGQERGQAGAGVCEDGARVGALAEEREAGAAFS